MSTRDPRIDAYIQKSPDFSRPILDRLRALVHQGCPEVQETMKWSMPFFEYKGLLCNMAAFKHHVAFGFWKGDLVLGSEAKGEAMGQFGRITSVADLPPDKRLLELIRKAARLNEQAVKPPSRTVGRRPANRYLKVPDFLASALAGDPRAEANFKNMSYSHRREYVEWLTEAKREETRQRRLATALAWISQGKSQNWKYERC
jgi:hypothetical protein